jgi:hypothetical protein
MFSADDSVPQKRSLSVVQSRRGEADEETGIISRGNRRQIPESETDRATRSVLHLLSGRRQAVMPGNVEHEL